MWLGDIGGLIRLLIPLAILGLLGAVGGVIWALVWIIQHVRFV